MSEASPSHWLRTVDPLPRREPLDGSVTTDVAVLGAGFTGLWAALSLLDADPMLNVVIVEQRWCG